MASPEEGVGFEQPKRSKADKKRSDKRMAKDYFWDQKRATREREAEEGVMAGMAAKRVGEMRLTRGMR